MVNGAKWLTSFHIFSGKHIVESLMFTSKLNVVNCHWNKSESLLIKGKIKLLYVCLFVGCKALTCSQCLKWCLLSLEFVLCLHQQIHILLYPHLKTKKNGTEIHNSCKIIRFNTFLQSNRILLCCDPLFSFECKEVFYFLFIFIFQHDIENTQQLPQKPPRDSSQPAKHPDKVHPFAIQSFMLGRRIV